MSKGNSGRKHTDFSLPQTVWGSLYRDFQQFMVQLNDELGSYGTKYQLKSWLTKYNGPGTTSAEARADAAVQKWLVADARNAATNQRLFWDDCVIAGVSTVSVVNTASKYIRRLLGSPDDIVWDLFPTNGASTRIRRSGVAAASKFEGKAHATERSLNRWLSVIEDTILANEEGLVYPSIVKGSVMFTVPKNSEIDRVACKEPEVNQWLQRAVGVHIRERLKRRAGIDLLDQSRNRNLAREGSVTGELATIDLSSASDLISRTLVNRLLPAEWYVLMDDIRVHECELPDGSAHEVEMFSSMGNGFTFELETLIFWGLCCAIQHHFHIRGVVSVYGDDIVVHPRTARLFRHFAAWFGFKVNAKKSFHRGRFRESCGGHYYGGRDVTPFFTRKPITHVVDLIQFLNQFREWFIRTYPYDWDTGYPFWLKYAKHVPRRFWGGKDIEGTGSLVTPGKRRSALVRSNVGIHRPEHGSYLLWMATRREGAFPVDVTPVRQSDWVVRRNRDWNVSIPLFSEEYYL